MVVFLTSTDEEKIVFQRYIEGHDNPSDVLVIDHSTMKFDFPNSNSPDYIKFDIPLSEFESSKAPSSYHKRSKTLQSKPLPPKSQRKRTIDIGGRNDTNETNSFGFLSLSEIDHHNSNDRLSVSIYSQKQGVSQQIYVSEVPSLAKSSKISGSSPEKQFSFAKNELKFPSIVDEESTQNLKSEQNRDFPIRTNYKLLNPDKRQKFAENAFLIGLAELMKNNNRPKQI